MKQTFRAKITGRGPNSAWTQLDIPFDVLQAFGSKAMVPVRGTLNDFPFRNSLKPNGDGTHYMHVNKALLAGAGVQVGAMVTVVMDLDKTPRTVTVPDDLRSALAKAPSLENIFDQLAYSHRKEFVDWIEQARRPETRTTRVAKTLELLAARKTPKG